MDELRDEACLADPGSPEQADLFLNHDFGTILNDVAAFRLFRRCLARGRRRAQAHCLEEGRLETAVDQKVADRFRPPLAQFGISLPATDCIRGPAHLDLNLESEPIGRRQAATDLIRQTRERGKSFRREVVFVQKKINKRALDDRLRLLERTHVEIGQAAFVDRLDARDGRRTWSHPHQPGMRCFAGKDKDAILHRGVDRVRQAKAIAKTLEHEFGVVGDLQMFFRDPVNPGQFDRRFRAPGRAIRKEPCRRGEASRSPPSRSPLLGTETRAEISRGPNPDRRSLSHPCL